MNKYYRSVLTVITAPQETHIEVFVHVSMYFHFPLSIWHTSCPSVSFSLCPNPLPLHLVKCSKTSNDAYSRFFCLSLSILSTETLLRSWDWDVVLRCRKWLSHVVTICCDDMLWRHVVRIPPASRRILRRVAVALLSPKALRHKFCEHFGVNKHCQPQTYTFWVQTAIITKVHVLILLPVVHHVSKCVGSQCVMSILGSGPSIAGRSKCLKIFPFESCFPLFSIVFHCFPLFSIVFL